MINNDENLCKRTGTYKTFFSYGPALPPWPTRCRRGKTRRPRPTAAPPSLPATQASTGQTFARAPSTPKCPAGHPGDPQPAANGFYQVKSHADGGGFLLEYCREGSGWEANGANKESCTTTGVRSNFYDQGTGTPVAYSLKKGQDKEAEANGSSSGGSSSLSKIKTTTPQRATRTSTEAGFCVGFDPRQNVRRATPGTPTGANGSTEVKSHVDGGFLLEYCGEGNGGWEADGANGSTCTTTGADKGKCKIDCDYTITSDWGWC